MLRIQSILILGAIVRVGLTLWGEVQDRSAKVRYTDIDYDVFTDGAAAVAGGGSPYDRATYRYTPLLAWALLPNVLVWAQWGKALFVAADLGVGLLIPAALPHNTPEGLVSAAVAAWVFNPIVAAISTRGSAEAVVVFPIVAALAAFRSKRPILAGLLIGLGIHVKLYPVIYIPAFAIACIPDNVPLSLGSITWRNYSGIAFGLASVAAFLLSSAAMYALYGETYLDQSFFYHVRRSDPRHNFSLYFYPMYLADTETSTGPTPEIGLWLSPFVPQLGLSLLAAFALARRDLPSTLLVQTLIFVAFNKVITSQYFVWFYALIPMCIPVSSLSWKSWIGLFLFFTLGQAAWLSRAYYLEFEGESTMFIQLWLASIFFMATMVASICIITLSLL